MASMLLTVGAGMAAAAAGGAAAAAASGCAGALFSSDRVDLNRARMASMDDMETACASGAGCAEPVTGSDADSGEGVCADTGVEALAPAAVAAVAILARSCSTDRRMRYSAVLDVLAPLAPASTLLTLRE